jgi:hypothetical protein
MESTRKPGFFSASFEIPRRLKPAAARQVQLFPLFALPVEKGAPQ